MALIAGCGGDSNSGTEAEDVSAAGGDTADAADVAYAPDLAGEVDAGPTEIDCAKTPGAFGCACETASDCVDPGSYCVPSRQAHNVCTSVCYDECPSGYACQKLGALTGSDATFLCIERGINLCRPCNANADCQAGGLGQTGDRCVTHGDAEGAFCGSSCASDAQCPPAYGCQEVPDAETGSLSKQCVPLAEGGGMDQCECSPRATLDGASTICKGGGVCEGARVCAAEGLTACDAPTPETELCDGADNNCNGAIDEGFANTDGDADADCVDEDDDGDGVLDEADNCPLVVNAGQEDEDGDGVGDVCDKPGTPTLSATTPTSPANENNPLVHGGAEPLTTIAVFDNAFCQGEPLVSDVAVADDGTWTAIVTVPDDSQTTFSALATDSYGNPSDCSTTPLIYVEDSVSPLAPKLDETTPQSPGQDDTPVIAGSAEPGAAIALFATAACDGAAVGSGQAGLDGTFEIEVAVVKNSETRWWAAATDAAGNVSVCTPGDGLVYVHDDIPPAPPEFTGTIPPYPSEESTTPIVLGTAEPSATVSLFVDPACETEAVGQDQANDQSGVFSIPTTVPENSITTYWARATDAAGNVSACSTDTVLFIHDNTAPVAPTLEATSPTSPGSAIEPVVSGGSEPFTVVRIYLKEDCTGAQVGEVSTGATGAVETTVAVTPNSESVLFGQAEDPTGHLSPCSSPGLVYVHDNIAPDAPAVVKSNPASPGSSLTVGLSGTAEPGAEVSLFATADCSGEPLGGSAASAEGQFAAVIEVAPDQPTDIYAQATDAAGNASPCAAEPFSYVHDGVAPLAPVLSGTNPLSPASTQTPTVLGTSEPGATITLYADAACAGSTIGTDTADANGDFAATVTVAANQATQVFATATDLAKNVSGCSAGVSYSHDDQQPTLPTLTGTDPASPSSTVTTPSVLGASDPGATIRLYTEPGCAGALVAQGIAGADGAFAIQATVAANSETRFYATSEDSAQNLSPCTPEGLAYVHDAVAPDAPILIGTEPGSPSGETTSPVVSVSGEVGATIEWFVGGSCQGAPAAVATADDLGAASAPVPVAPNFDSTIRAHAVDAAGNISGCSGALLFTHDSVAPPAPTLTGSAPGSPAASMSPELAGTAEAGAQVRIYQEANCQGAVVGATPAGGGSFAVTVPAGKNQTTSFSADATDAAGNTSPCSAALAYVNDSDAPDAPALTHTDPPSPSTTDTSPVVQGVAAANSTVALFDNASCQGAPIATVEAGGQGQFSVPTTVAPNTKTTFSASATDGVGNTSPCSNPLVYVHDNQPPGAPQWTGSTPTSPGSSPTPALHGTSEADTVVEVFLTADCSGASVATANTGDGQTFTAVIAAQVAPNASTTFYARATDLVGNDSPCSAGFEYQHDDIAPAPPVVEGTDPVSPAGERHPAVLGTGEPGAQITLFLDAACSQAVNTSGTVKGDGQFSALPIAALPANQTSTIYAEQTDAAGNVSACSPTSVSYTHDSAAPGTPVWVGVSPASPSSTDLTPTLSGQATPDVVDVIIYTGSSPCADLKEAISAAADGSFVYEATVTVNSKTLFWARVVDEAGNTSGCTAVPLEYIHDSQAPVFPGGYDGPTAALDTPATSLTLTWPDADDNFTPPAKMVYEVCLSTQCDDPCDPWAPDFTLTDGATSVVVPGLEPNTRYYLITRARDEAGNLDANTLTTTVKTPGHNMARSLRLGPDQSCAFVATGALSCWGDAAGPDQTGLVDVAMGPAHRCVVTEAGHVTCSGDNSSGQLGNGSIAPVTGAVTVPGLVDVVEVAVGAQHTCARRANGTVACWGYNEHNAVGPGEVVESSPREILLGPGAPLTGATHIMVGAEHSCALTGDGRAFCWGFNWAGQVGDGTTGVSPYASAVDLSEAGAFVDLALGTDHTCGVAADGRVFCWGYNDNGQLGLPSATLFAHTPTPNGVTGAVSVSARARHACAVRVDGSVRCWGNNEAGQLGANLTAASSHAALAVLEDQNGSLVPLIGVRAIASGPSHVCALLATGELRCWGDNAGGQLGTANVAVSPVAVPVTVLAGVSTITRLSHSVRHACAVLSDGSGRCWGANTSGQVAQPLAPVAPVTVVDTPSGSAILDIQTGGGHSCALLAGGEVRCWGANDALQLGAPGVGGGAVTVPVSDITQITLGEAHTCAKTVTGQAICWGDNTFGQAGGAVGGAKAPAVVSLPGPILAIEAGAYHTCVILAAGGPDAVRCWGQNQDGQLGTAAGGPVGSPAVGPTLAAAPVSLSAGLAHTCALLVNGELACFGADADQQSSGGSTLDRLSAISAGDAHGCVLGPDRLVRCFGADGAGQLGGASVGGAPVTLSSLGASLAVEAGQQATCAVTTDGHPFCWGENQGDRLNTGGPALITAPSPVRCLP